MQSTLNYDCKSCSDSDKDVRGCSMTASVVIMVHGVKGYASRCPVIDTAEVHEYFQVMAYWEQGQYPNSGTWAEQPNRLVEAMEAIRVITKNANPS